MKFLSPSNLRSSTSTKAKKSSAFSIHNKIKDNDKHTTIVEDGSARTEDTTILIGDEYLSSSGSQNSSQDHISSVDESSHHSPTSTIIEEDTPSKSLEEAVVAAEDEKSISSSLSFSLKTRSFSLSRSQSLLSSRRRSFSLSRKKRQNCTHREQQQQPTTSSRSTRSRSNSLRPKSQSSRCANPSSGASTTTSSSTNTGIYSEEDEGSLLRCPYHPYVELARCSSRTGVWKMLLDTCPVCDGEHDVPSPDFVTLRRGQHNGMEPKHQKEKAKYRGRSRQGISRSQSSKTQMKREDSSSSILSKQSCKSTQSKYSKSKYSKQPDSLEDQLQSIKDQPQSSTSIKSHPSSNDQRSRKSSRSRSKTRRQQPKRGGFEGTTTRSSSSAVDDTSVEQLIMNSYSTINRASQSIRVNQRSISNEPRLLQTRLSDYNHCEIRSCGSSCTKSKLESQCDTALVSMPSESASRSHAPPVVDHIKKSMNPKSSTRSSSESRSKKSRSGYCHRTNQEVGTARRHSSRRFEKIEREMEAMAREKEEAMALHGKKGTNRPESAEDKFHVKSVNQSSRIQPQKHAQRRDSTPSPLSHESPPGSSQETAEANVKLPPEALAIIEDMRAENRALHQSVEEAMELASGMNAQMATFVATHNESVAEYETKLATLKASSANLSHDFTRALRKLKEENSVLRAAVSEGDGMEDEAEEYYERRLKEAEVEKQDAYKTCEVLQREIDALQRMLEEFDTGSRNAGGNDESNLTNDMMSSLLNMSGLLSCIDDYEENDDVSTESKEDEFMVKWLTKTEGYHQGGGLSHTNKAANQVARVEEAFSASELNVNGRRRSSIEIERLTEEDELPCHEESSTLLSSAHDTTQSNAEVLELAVGTMGYLSGSSDEDEESLPIKKSRTDNMSVSSESFNDVLDSISGTSADFKQEVTTPAVAEVVQKALLDYPIEVDRSIASVWSSFYDDDTTTGSKKDKDSESHHPWRRKNETRSRRGYCFSDETEDDY